MNIFLATAALATCVTIGSIGASSALEVIYYHPGLFNFDSSGSGYDGAYDPNANKGQSIEDVCPLKGGELIREIKPDGKLGYRCYIPKS